MLDRTIGAMVKVELISCCVISA